MMYKCEDCEMLYDKEDLEPLSKEDREEYVTDDVAGNCPDEECGSFCFPAIPEVHEWKYPRYAQFAEELQDAGYEVYRYRGRFYYDGPAVNCSHEEYQDIIRATQVKVQSDSMGMGLVVYPC